MTYIEELTNTKQKQRNSMVAGISSKILQIRKATSTPSNTGKTLLPPSTA